MNEVGEGSISAPVESEQAVTDIPTPEATPDELLTDQDKLGMVTDRLNAPKVSPGDTEVSEKPEKTEVEKTIDALIEHYGGQVFKYVSYQGTVAQMFEVCPPAKAIAKQGFDAVVRWLEPHKIELVRERERLEAEKQAQEQKDRENALAAQQAAEEAARIAEKKTTQPEKPAVSPVVERVREVPRERATPLQSVAAPDVAPSIEPTVVAPTFVSMESASASENTESASVNEATRAAEEASHLFEDASDAEVVLQARQTGEAVIDSAAALADVASVAVDSKPSQGTETTPLETSGTYSEPVTLASEPIEKGGAIYTVQPIQQYTEAVSESADETKTDIKSEPEPDFQLGASISVLAPEVNVPDVQQGIAFDQNIETSDSVDDEVAQLVEPQSREVPPEVYDEVFVEASVEPFIETPLPETADVNEIETSVIATETEQKIVHWQELAQQQVPLETLLITVVDELFDEAPEATPIDAVLANEVGEEAEANFGWADTAIVEQPIVELNQEVEPATEKEVSPELEALFVQVYEVKTALRQLRLATTKEECKTYVDTLVVELAVLLRALGYDNPEKVVRDFLSSHPLASLQDLIEVLEQALRARVQPEMLTHVAQPGAQTRSHHTIFGRIALAVLGQFPQRIAQPDFSV